MDQRGELREFLRSRRARLRLEDVGLPSYGGQRRVQGLRREEVAQLAGVSVDYYVRLEQGRNHQVSESVLDAVARALQLSEAEHTHLRNLAKPVRGRRGTALPRPQRVRAGTARLVETMEHGPAYVLGRNMEILAWNRLASVVFGDFGALPPDGRNMARIVFLDPRARETFLEWGEAARSTVAFLRLAAGRNPEDQYLAALVGELTMKSDEFRRLWAEHPVADKTYGAKRLHHPAVGELCLNYESLRLTDDNEQLLFAFTAEANSPSETSLRLLSMWNGGATVGDRHPLPAADADAVRHAGTE